MTDQTGEGPVAPLPILENLLAAEVYADAAAFFSFKSGNVSITFVSHRYDNSTPSAVPKHVVIGRLVIPLEGAQGLAVGLFDYLKQRGLIPETPEGSKN
jgi:hypothetical protein